MVSIEDVAERAGVSVATVSRALRGLPNVASDTRTRVQEAAQELDYVSDPSAARLAAGRTRTLGIVMPGLGRWFGSRMMAAVHQVWSAAGHDLLALVVDDHATRTRFVRDLPFRKRVDGLLLMDVPFSEAEHERLAETGVAVVRTGAPSDQIASVGIDDREAARALVEHLLELGHSDLALLAGDVEEPFMWAGPSDRIDGARDALEAADIQLDDDRVATTDWSLQEAAAAAARLLDARSEPPTALVCFSDEMAIAAMGVLRERGLDVPGDVSVVGFDDHDLAEHVGLTTIHQPVELMGRRAAAHLLRRLEDSDDPGGREVLATRLIVRASTTVPRHAADTDAVTTDDRPGHASASLAR